MNLVVNVVFLSLALQTNNILADLYDRIYVDKFYYFSVPDFQRKVDDNAAAEDTL